MPALTLCPGSRWATVALCALAASCEGTLHPPSSVGTVRIVNAPASLPVGESVRLSAVALDVNGDPLPNQPVYWGAVDTTVVHVDSVTGMAHARSPGTTRIVASSKDKRDRVDMMVPPGPPLAFNTVVVDELNVADNIDEFTFGGSAGQQVNVFLQGTTSSASDQFRLRVLGPGGNALDSVTSRGSDAALRKQAIRELVLPQSGTYRVRVEANPGAERKTYQLMVETINPAPETVPAALNLASAVTAESLSPGDIDDFTFPGRNGQEVSILFRARSGRPGDALRLRLLGPGGTELRFVHSNGDYAAAQASGRVQLPLDGAYTVRVQGMDAEAQGPYEFQVFSISRSPETAAASIGLGTTVENETLSPPGDVDEFSLAVTTQAEVNVYFRVATGARADSMVLRMLGTAGTVLDTVMSQGGDEDLLRQAISHLSLPAATYRVQVDGARSARGSYLVLVRPIDLAPEGTSAVVGYGTPVTNESITPAGDVDQFRFHGSIGDVLRIRFRAVSGAASDELRLYLYLPDGREVIFLTAYGDRGEQTYSHVLPQTGDYRIRVQGVNSIDDSGPYWFQIDRTNP